MSDIQKGAYRAGAELTVTELGLKRRSETDALRYVLQKIAEFPYVGEQAAQRMQMMAKGALAVTSTECAPVERKFTGPGHLERTGYIDPLPRCEHGNCLMDGGGEALEPPCGCR